MQKHYVSLISTCPFTNLLILGNLIFPIFQFYAAAVAMQSSWILRIMEIISLGQGYFNTNVKITLLFALYWLNLY